MEREKADRELLLHNFCAHDVEGRKAVQFHPLFHFIIECKTSWQDVIHGKSPAADHVTAVSAVLQNS